MTFHFHICKYMQIKFYNKIRRKKKIALFLCAFIRQRALYIFFLFAPFILINNLCILYLDELSSKEKITTYNPKMEL